MDMKIISVKPMNCEFASEGLLCIEKIASGVAGIFFNPEHKFAAGFHVLRGTSKGNWAGNPGCFSDTAVEHVIQEFTKRGIFQNLSVAIAGGSSLLASTDIEKLGSLLVHSVKHALCARNLPIKFENVGGTKIRSIILNVDEGKIKISEVNLALGNRAPMQQQRG
jgi:chemotaxis receptor (MCP) glutamine deamidase CheD